MRKKAIYIVEEPKLGGPQVQMARVAAALSDRWDVRLLIPDGDNALFCRLCDSLAVKYEVITLSGLTRQPGPLLKFIVRTPSEVMSLIAKIRAEKPDIIHAWGGAWQFKAAIASMRTGVPLVWLLNDTSLPGYVRAIFRLFAQRSAAFIFASHRTAEYYSPLLPERAATRVIQSMVDLEAFDPDKNYAGDEELIATWGDDFVAGVIANVSPVKGLETFVDIAGRAKAAGRKARFVVVGQTYRRQEPLRAELLAQAQRLGADNIEFVGARKDVRALLSRFDAYLCTSLSESSPVAVWEALAMAKPVVSTRVGDVPVFVKDGEAGFVAEVGDDATLWAHLDGLIANPHRAAAMGAKARRVAQETFGSELVAAQTEAFYERAIADHSGPNC